MGVTVQKPNEVVFVGSLAAENQLSEIETQFLDQENLEILDEASLRKAQEKGNCVSQVFGYL